MEEEFCGSHLAMETCLYCFLCRLAVFFLSPFFFYFVFVFRLHLLILLHLHHRLHLSAVHPAPSPLCRRVDTWPCCGIGWESASRCAPDLRAAQASYLRRAPGTRVRGKGVFTVYRTRGKGDHAGPEGKLQSENLDQLIDSLHRAAPQCITYCWSHLLGEVWDDAHAKVSPLLGEVGDDAKVGANLVCPSACLRTGHDEWLRACTDDLKHNVTHISAVTSLRLSCWQLWREITEFYLWAASRALRFIALCDNKIFICPVDSQLVASCSVWNHVKQWTREKA